MKTIVNGIILKRIPFSETSLIVGVFTRQKGLKTYLFPGGKKKKSHTLQPLTIVELETFERPDSELGKISAIETDYVFQSLPFHPVKSGLAFFLAELLASCLKTEEEDVHCFDFLSDEIQFLDNSNELGLYPSWFLLEFTQHLGCTPHILDRESNYLDLVDGTLTSAKPYNHAYINSTSVHWIAELLTLSKEEGLSLQIPKAERKILLNDLLTYYKYHVDGFKIPKSLEILETVWG
jgi:DNA repair protein RecO (recombination protein O)